MPKQKKPLPGSRQFPGSRRAPDSEDLSEDSPTGRRGRVRRGRFADKGFADKNKNERQGAKGGRFVDRSGARRGHGRDDRHSKIIEVDDSQLGFSDLLMQLARRAAPDLIQGDNHPEPLVRLPYAQELELKNRALQEFWTAHGLPDKPNQVLPSPRPRGYRTTTKRRVVFLKGRYDLTFLTESFSASHPRAGAESMVEPREHKAIYDFLLSKLNTPAYANLASALNYLIIRGDYARFTVLFNVHRLNADVVRKAKMMGDHLKDLETKVVSAFMFFDPSKSDFYFEARNPEGPWKIKKIFGPDDIHLKVLDRTYAFHPTSFCQVNASILPLFLEKADQLLKPKPEYRLLDLYSGFGFFTLHLGPNYGEAFGVDLGMASIESGQRMASADPAAHCRFKAGRIVVKNLDKLLPPATGDKPEVLLLDPPRQGTEPGVIRALAARNPARILHVFCDLDTLPKEVNQWRKSGFMVSKVVPLDMFPGTDNLEVMVLFIPDRYGILNRIDKSRTETTNLGDEDVLLDGDAGSDSEEFEEDGEGGLRPAAKTGKSGRRGRPAGPGKPHPGGSKGKREFARGGFKTEQERAEYFAKSKAPRGGDRPAKEAHRSRPGKPGFKPREDRGDRPAGRFQGDRPDRGFERGPSNDSTRGTKPGRKPGPGPARSGSARPGPSRKGGDRPVLPDHDVRPGKGGARVERRDRKPRGRKS